MKKNKNLWPSSRWNKMTWKKKTVQESWMGYYPFSSLGSRYNILYRDRQVEQTRSKGHDTASSLYRETGVIRPGEGPRYGVGSCDTRSSARGGVATQRLRHSARHGRACADTWPGQAYDTAPGAPPHGQPSKQHAHRLGQGWVHCALDSVLTQCTVLSHCLGHCSRGFQEK